MLPLTSTPASSKDDLAGLVGAAARGDVEAMGRLLKQLAPGMIRAAHAMMGAAHPDVDDVVQQSMIAFVQVLPGFRGECSPAHFASGIVAKVSLAAKRRARTRYERQDDAVELDGLEADRVSQPEQVGAARRRAAVRALLDELPEDQAQALALRIVFGFSLAEVSASTGAPSNTIRSRVRLAKEALRRRIEARPELLELLEEAS